MNKKTGLMILMILPVFLLYFISEAFLRCAAVANINPDKVKLDNILNDLPESVRDIVTYRIMHTDMTNDLAAAQTEEEKLYAMAVLGEYTRDPEEKERIFSALRENYAANPIAAPAFVYYFLNEKSKKQLSAAEFHRYLSKFPQLEQFTIWALALNKFRTLKKPEREQLAFMMPLLKLKPEYRDYSLLYTEMVRLASKLRERETANQADAKIDESRFHPSIAEILMEREMEMMKKNSAGNKKGK